ncbi:MAG: FtsX-like permease family protein, partial [bacterium]|nr:FtsX-like permease family protein [bacterium]
MRTEYRKPPGFAGWVFRTLLFEKESRFLTGDYAEIYNIMHQEKGRLKALLWYWTHLLITIPHIMKKFSLRSGAMLKNYIKITFRNIKRQKGYSFINIFGLAIGMACCILILLFIQDELSYDRYHENADNIYRVTYNEVIGGVFADYALSPFSFAPAMVEELPEVESFVRFFRRNGLITIGEKNFEENGILYADSTFFEIFSHEFIQGVPESCLEAPRSIVLTEESALKLFGTKNVLGRTLLFNSSDELQVTGIIKNVPDNSHFSFNYIISSSTLLSTSERFRNLYGGWLTIFGWSYVLLDENADTAEIERKFEDIFERNSGSVAREYGIEVQMKLQKITDIHLRSQLQSEIGATGDIVYVYIFSAIAAFILVIACINFINLSTARSVKRAKEVGLRKVFGAARKRLTYQFISESISLAFIGLFISFIVVTITLPLFNDITGKSISLIELNRPVLWAGAVLLVLFTGLFAGSYPAFYLSSFDPVSALKNKYEKTRGSLNFRNVLVILQFTISITLITSTFIIMEQLDYMKNKNLGFEKEQVLAVRIFGRELAQNKETLKNELKQNPGIVDVSFCSGFPGRVNNILTVLQEGKPINESHTMDYVNVDFDFVKTFGVEIVQGRDFSTQYSTDTSGTFLINETAARKLDWGDQAVGKLIGFSPDNMNRIVGIVKDFHFKSLKRMIEPLVITLDTDISRYLTVKIKTGNLPETISFIEDNWKKFESDRAFDYFFIDDHFNSLYRSEEKLGKIITSFALIAIIVACLGLFGLASFTAEQKTKEIGIRKVLGAASSKLILILSAEFTKWVIVANAIALPSAYYLMNNFWLGEFAYPASIGLKLFSITFFLSLVIALLTVGFQALKA